MSQVEVRIIRVVANDSALVRRIGEVGSIVIAWRAPKRLFLIAASVFLHARASCTSCKSFAQRKADFIACLSVKKRKVREVRRLDFLFRRCRALFVLNFAAHVLSYNEHCGALLLEINTALLVRRTTTLRSQCLGSHAPRAVSRALQATLVAPQGLNRSQGVARAQQQPFSAARMRSFVKFERYALGPLFSQHSAWFSLTASGVRIVRRFFNS